MSEPYVNPQEQQSDAEIVERILALNHWRNICDPSKLEGPGQFVVTGPQPRDPNKTRETRIGYCVQVRKRCGQFGSDLVFLRHPDGGLTTHENQSFFAMTEEQEALARPIFEVLPEDEDYSLGFSSYEKIREIGYVIENSASQPSPVTPSMMTITTTGEDGTLKREITAFL